MATGKINSSKKWKKYFFLNVDLWIEPAREKLHEQISKSG